MQRILNQFLLLKVAFQVLYDPNNLQNSQIREVLLQLDRQIPGQNNPVVHSPLPVRVVVAYCRYTTVEIRGKNNLKTLE